MPRPKNPLTDSTDKTDETATQPDIAEQADVGAQYHQPPPIRVEIRSGQYGLKAEITGLSTLEAREVFGRFGSVIGMAFDNDID